MKKATFLILLSSALITACSTDGGDKGITFEKVKVERSLAISDSKDAPHCSVTLEIDQVRMPSESEQSTKEHGVERLINETVVNRLFGMKGLTPKAAADSFANQYTREYRKNLAALYREDASDPTKRPWYEYSYSVTTETRHGADGITSYLIHLNYYEGGAHGVSQLLVLNFDDKTGRCLTVADLFDDKGQQELPGKLLKALLAKTGEDDLESLRQRGYLYSMDMFVPENFIVDDDEVTFVFNPYEIAPYSEGIIELRVKRE